MATIVATTLVVVAAGCRPRAGARAEDATPFVRDTVRGVLLVVGAEPLTTLVLAPSNGTASLAIEGSQASVLRGLSRLEVMVLGRPTSRRSSASPSTVVFEVDSFVVRAADRVVAHDGIVGVDGGRYHLAQGASRVAVAFMPADLQRRLGARVFLVGPLDQAPVAYGVIVPAP